MRQQWPMVERPDAGAVLVEAMDVDPDRQADIAEQVLAHWTGSPWPHGLLSVSCFGSIAGAALLTYSQWAIGTTPTPLPAVDDRGIRVVGSARYTHYRSVSASISAPQCVFIAAIEIPERRSAQDWIDTVLDSVEKARERDGPYPGMIGAHYHQGTENQQALNFAEWRSAEDHERFMDSAVRWSAMTAVGGVPRLRFGGELYRLCGTVGPAVRNGRP